MDRYKLLIDILKYKITFFTTIIGAATFLLLNSPKFLYIINKWLFWIIVFMMIGYVFINLKELNQIKERIENE